MSTDLLSHFSAIQDPRSDKNKLYDLKEILLLCVCAVVAELKVGRASIRSVVRS